MSKKKSPAKPKAAKTVKPAKVKAAAPAKTEAVVKNGVTQPGETTACRAIWNVLDKMRADEREFTFDAVRKATDSKSADATVRTQWARWRSFNGLKRAKKDA